MRLLLVEDDLKIAKYVSQGLREAGFAVDHVGNGIEAFTFATNTFYDLMIVDVMLPGRDGLSLIEALRKQKINTPILVLSARQTVGDRVEGLSKGGDDYLTKPFAFSELLARIRALLRRAGGGANQEPTKLTLGDLSLDLLAREAVRAGNNIPLQNKEFKLLEYLMRNTGMVVSKTMIIEHVWDYNFDTMTNIVEARMSRLREKIDKPFDKKMIHTIRGAGYTLKA